LIIFIKDFIYFDGTVDYWQEDILFLFPLLRKKNYNNSHHSFGISLVFEANLLKIGMFLV